MNKWILLLSCVSVSAAAYVPAQYEQAKTTAICQQCDLTRSDFTSFNPGKLSKKTASIHSDFSGSDFSYSKLNRSNFTVSIRGYVTALASASFKNSILKRSHLKNSTYIGVNFDKANLSFVKFNNSNLHLSSFNQADFSYADLSDVNAVADAMHGWGCDMRGAIFTYAKLKNATIYANFQGANFSFADLRNATLTAGVDAVPNKAWQSSELWQGVDFSYANLRDATIKTVGGDKTDFSKAIFCKTVMPDGSTNNRDCKPT